MSSPEDTDWKASWKRFGPLTGLAGLLLAFIGIFASLAILLTSHNVPTTQWKIQPSTYLAIVTAVANQAMGYAAVQGVVIAWWTRSLSGSSLGSLHWDWDIGNNIWSALTAGRHSNLLSMACIVSTLVAVDGPLLQRATSVAHVPSNISVELDFAISQEIPHGMTGSYSHMPGAETLGIMEGRSFRYNSGQTNGIANVAVEWARGKPIHAEVQGCNGTCRASVRAPTLAKTNCTRSTIPFDPPKSRKVAEEFRSFGGLLFYVDFGIIPDETGEAINYTVAYRKAKGCENGQVTRMNCRLRSAVGLYHIHLDGASISLPGIGGVEVQQLANNTAWRPRIDGEPEILSTLSGIVFQAKTMYSSLAYGFDDRGTALRKYGYTGFVQQFAVSPRSNGTGNCGIYRTTESRDRFSDPTDYILSSLNELMFRVGIEAASYDPSFMAPLLDMDMSLNQTSSGIQYGHENVYKTNLSWFVAAAATEMLCIVCIVPTYWGWWKIGRAVSFSPLEIAKAFGAPSLADCPSNASAKGVARVYRSVPIRYGATSKAKGGPTEYEANGLVFADPREIYRPLDCFRFES